VTIEAVFRFAIEGVGGIDTQVESDRGALHLSGEVVAACAVACPPLVTVMQRDLLVTSVANGCDGKLELTIRHDVAVATLEPTFEVSAVSRAAAGHGPLRLDLRRYGAWGFGAARREDRAEQAQEQHEAVQRPPAAPVAHPSSLHDERGQAHQAGVRVSNAVKLNVVSVLAGLTLGVSAVAACILLVYWVKQPRLDLKWRLLLFLAIALLPTVAAGTSTTEALNVTSERQFCGSCHVMEAHYKDAIDPGSMSLSARHTRNDAFGEHSCYKCHAEYGMFGYPLTKLNGLRHVWHYYFGEYGSMTLEEALPKLHTYKPYPNENCEHCHTGSGKIWLAVPDHRAVDADVRADKVSCASIGCHGAPHPDSARARAAAAEKAAGAGAPATAPTEGQP